MYINSFIYYVFFTNSSILILKESDSIFGGNHNFTGSLKKDFMFTQVASIHTVPKTTCGNKNFVVKGKID